MRTRVLDPADFYGAVAGRGLAAGSNYMSVAGIGGGWLYADQVFGTLRTGASKTILSGETVSLPVSVLAPGSGTSLAAKPPMVWYRADWSNYSVAYRGA